jgi:hypothetical protein
LQIAAAAVSIIATATASNSGYKVSPNFVADFVIFVVQVDGLSYSTRTGHAGHIWLDCCNEQWLNSMLDLLHII